MSFFDKKFSIISPLTFVLLHPQSILCPLKSPTIDKISSLSCQKVAYSITSPKIGGSAAKQTSVLLRNTSEYILCYPSSYCTVFLINKSNPSTVRRGVVGKASDNISIQETYYAWAYHRISVLFPLFFFF